MPRLILRVELSPDQYAAVMAYQAEKRKSDPAYEFSHEHRRILMRAIGRKDLAGVEMKRGRKPKAVSE